jgi:imidazolonepropionase-like amidohydrolase
VNSPRISVGARREHHRGVSCGSGLAILLVMAAWPSAVGAAPKAFLHARIIPISRPEIPDGVLVVDNGKILSVGPYQQVTIPEGAERIDVTGKVLMPGLICTHSHIGDWSGGSQRADTAGSACGRFAQCA